MITQEEDKNNDSGGCDSVCALFVRADREAGGGDEGGKWHRKNCGKR